MHTIAIYEDDSKARSVSINLLYQAKEQSRLTLLLRIWKHWATLIVKTCYGKINIS